MQSMLLLDTDQLSIRFEPGNTGTVVVSFTGIGFGFGGIQREEFVNTLQSSDRKNASIYVVDKTRSWYNRTHSDILDALNLVTQDFENVVTLGNSMGGFGALYFSGLLPRCRRAVAFVPQYSVGPLCSDPRWMEWRSSIDAWPVSNALANLSTEAPAIIVFGEDELHDHWHRAEIQRRVAAPHAVITLAGVGHEVAVAMKRKGALRTVIQKAFNGVPAEVLRNELENAGFALS
jgi:pimeloyl-ACP methyl ester carboxylesterase